MDPIARAAKQPVKIDIQERLRRLESLTVTRQSARPQVCGLKSGCQDCGAHPGVVLDASQATITAHLCACVRQCQVCAGSCMTPRGDGVQPCAKSEPRKIVNLVNEAKIPSRYLEADLTKFTGFNPSDTSPKVILNWLKNLQPGRSSGLLFSGPVGMGKSWLLAAIAKQLTLQGISVRYADFFQLVHELRDAYATDQADKSSLRPLQQVDVLIIDELGKGRNSEWELSVADSLISERYNSNKCMVAATNYPLRGSSQDLSRRQTDYLSPLPAGTNQMNAMTFEPLSERIGSRMFSRLSENCICLEVSGPDRRRQ
jgi:DNA replication protein DnaC